MRNNLLSLMMVLSSITGNMSFGLSENCVSGQSKDEPRSIEVRVVDSQQQTIKEAELLFFDGRLGKKLEIEKTETAILKTRSGLLIARAKGFQYGGLVIDHSSPDIVNLILKRDDEAGAVKSTLPFPLESTQRAKVYNQLLDEAFLELEQTNDSPSQGIYLQILAGKCPDRVLEYLKANPRLPPPVVLSAKVELVKALSKKNAEQAIELIARSEEPIFQTFALEELVKALPIDSPQLASCETQWMRSIELIPEPQLKLAAAASAGEYFQLRGRDDRAKQIINNYLEQAEQLPSAGWSCYPRSLFAALIVSSDPERARKILSKFHPASDQEVRELLRGKARLAFAASLQNLELTLQLLGEFDELDTENKNFAYRLKVLQRLAARYPQAAVEQARKLTDLNWRAWTLGNIADRIGDTNQQLARQSLADAVQAAMDSAASSPSDQPSLNHPAIILGGLLPIAERVAPDQVESMIWQTIWCAVPKSRFVVSGPSHSLAIQQSAAAICRYDREIGLALFRDRQPNQTFRNDGNSAAVFILNPNGISDHLARLSVNQPLSMYRARETLLNLLSESESSAWDRVSLPFLLEWNSDLFEDR